MAKEVNVIINKDGSKVDVDAQHFEGSACKDFLGSILTSLGNIEVEKKKPEFYTRSKQTVRA